MRWEVIVMDGVLRDALTGLAIFAFVVWVFVPSSHKPFRGESWFGCLLFLGWLEFLGLAFARWRFYEVPFAAIVRHFGLWWLFIGLIAWLALEPELTYVFSCLRGSRKTQGASLESAGNAADMARGKSCGPDADSRR